MRKRFVLKNKRRFAAIIIILATFSISMFMAGRSYGYKEPQYKLITVREGDTLWEIARKNNNGSDIRRYIYEIEKINNISNSIIYPGTILKIPVY